MLIASSSRGLGDICETSEPQAGDCIFNEIAGRIGRNNLDSVFAEKSDSRASTSLAFSDDLRQVLKDVCSPRT